MPHKYCLSKFVESVQSGCLMQIGDARFSGDQSELLTSTMQRLFELSDPGDWGQPLGLFYAVYRICGAAADEVALSLGKFAAFYIASADLFDDVQDEDLAGKPHECVGAAIATNSALTLLTLALDTLGHACEMESRAERKLRYLRLFNRVSLIAVDAQHRDLLGQKGAQTREEVESMHRGKTSSVALLCECAAIAGGADEDGARKFYQIGEELAASVQVIDDVRDLVAKEQSIDLLTGKSTYPLACFFELASERQREQLDKLLGAAPIALDEVRELLASVGAFDQCAAAVEGHRNSIFELLRSMEARGGHVQLLFEIVDQLAFALYEPAPRTEPLYDQTGAFAVSVQAMAAHYVNTMRVFGFREAPSLRPWHLPIFLYSPEREQIYFSDLDTLSEEILPFHAKLQKSDHAEARASIERSVPFVVAHELTHAFRDQLGLLSGHGWHEEYVANQIAFAYVQAHAPDAAHAVVAASRRMLLCQADAESRRTRRRIIESCIQQGSDEDYGLSPEQAALVHAEMIISIADSPVSLDTLAELYLMPETPMAAE